MHKVQLSKLYILYKSQVLGPLGHIGARTALTFCLRRAVRWLHFRGYEGAAQKRSDKNGDTKKAWEIRGFCVPLLSTFIGFYLKVYAQISQRNCNKFNSFFCKNVFTTSFYEMVITKIFKA